MRTEKFKAVVGSVASMTEAQLDQHVVTVEQRRVRTKALHILEAAGRWPLAAGDRGKCLHCGSTAVVKNGHSCGLQRYGPVEICARLRC
jgi:hypothetical protein